MKTKRLNTFVVACFALGTLGVVTACNPKPAVIEATSIALNKTETSIILGSTETLTVTFTPGNTSNKDVVWSTSDATVASVNNGVVTANKVGTATITATSASNDQLNASCTVSVTDTVVLSSVSAKHEFVVYEANKAKPDTGDDGFYDRTQVYKVGDDNNFNVKPELTVLDVTTGIPVSASEWNYDFTITATYNGQTAGSEYFSVVDARECDVKFTEAAVGKTFTINIAPGGVSQSRVASLTKSITVEVLDGYNVYDAKELGYFDTRAADDGIDEVYMEGGVQWKAKWTEFKTANNLRNNYAPASLILQQDIKVTPKDIPSNFIYTAKEASDVGDAAAANSMRDWINIYGRTIAGDFILDGNYFALDFSELPLIKREGYEKTEEGAVVGHSSIFKTMAGNDIKFRNINMTGNAQKAQSDADKIYGGGLIFVKGAGSETFSAYNIIATKFFITFMGQTPHIPGYPITKFSLDKVKCFNNYNSFMYNWGSTVTASNSLFRSCGGPIIIQDHAGTDDYEANNGFVTFGYVPTTTFVDCTLKNLVNGTEAWFKQFGADLLAPTIKSLSDLLYGTGFSKSFVTNAAGEGKLNMALSAAGEVSYFNFIVLNKSGKAEGITTVPACGNVNFVETNKTTTFNYRQPDGNDEVYQAYYAYSAAQGADKDAALQTLLAVATEKGIITGPTDPDSLTKILGYFQTLATAHVMIRTFNNEPYNAPVFDLGEGFDPLSISSQTAQYLTSTYNLAQGNTDRYTLTPAQVAAFPNNLALYYNGMALVMGLADYVA